MSSKNISFFNDNNKNKPAPKAYLNLWLPTGHNDSRRKLGSIALRGNSAAEKDLIAWLQEDPSRVGLLLSKLTMDFQEAAPAAASGFDLSLEATVKT